MRSVVVVLPYLHQYVIACAIHLAAHGIDMGNDANVPRGS
jgi:hypothetical protein